MSDPPSTALQARSLIRGRPVAALATTIADGGWPYASLVLVACAQDATPLLLISTLAEHTKNLSADPRVSLLFEATAGLDNPLTGARLSLLGRAERSEAPADRDRFLRRHPEAEMYAQFKDFAFYRVLPDRAHLVAGFGRIHWVAGDDLLDREAPALAEAEAGIIEHMNQDHADAIQLYAVKLLGLSGGGWRMTGCDAEGCDLRRGGDTARLAFSRRVLDAGAAREELVRLVKSARVS